MAKLQTGSSKLSELHVKSDASISQKNLISNDTQVVGIIQKNKNLIKTKSFRVSDDDLKTLESIRISVNKESKTYISDSKIIKALIQIGSKVEAQKILRAIAETL